MITSEWKDIVIHDLTDEEYYHYTQNDLERQLEDIYECMRLDNLGRPETVWFENHVLRVIAYERLWGDLSIVVVERNPLEV